MYVKICHKNMSLSINLPLLCVCTSSPSIMITKCSLLSTIPTIFSCFLELSDVESI